MEFSKFVEWTFYGVLSGSSVYLVTILSGLKTSVEELNLKMAVIIEKTSHHEKRIEKLEDRMMIE